MKKPSKTSKRQNAAWLDREADFYAGMKKLMARKQLAPRFIEQARPIVAEYTVVLEPHEGGGYRGRTLELPYVVGFGKTADECTARVHKSQAIAVGSMLAHGQPIPPAAIENKRLDQVNIKLTKREKAFMTAAAKREGFRSVADFMRSLAMRRVA